MGIGPSSKETTLHHFNDPVTELLRNEKSLDFMGIIVEGTPEVCDNKQFIADRAGFWCESMRADGAIVSIDSWGNSHVDFTSVIEAIGEKGIPVVGMSFVGNQASFVVTNKYMDTIIDLNKTAEGIETCIVGQNTATSEDAAKAIAILKNKMNKKHGLIDYSATAHSEAIRKLMMRTFQINDVIFADTTAIERSKIYLSRDRLKEVIEKYKEINDMKIHILKPGDDKMFVNANLDYSPIAAKVLGSFGEGITHVISGVTVMITGAETKESGAFQASNIGSSEGILKEHVIRNKFGTPKDSDIIIHFDITFNKGHARTREGILSAHKAADEFVQEIREGLKKLDSSQASRKCDYYDVVKKDCRRVVLIKLVSGLGCMYETAIFPYEPGGCLGCRSIMDIANMQILITPNQYKDGVIHSLC